MSREYFAKLLREADTDGDGFVSLDEWIGIWTKRGSCREHILREILRYHQFDDAVVRNGQLVTNIEAHLDKLDVVPEDERRAIIARYTFDHFDKNEDGVLDRSELQAMLAWSKGTYGDVLHNFAPDDVEKLLETADLDKSGTLSYEEFVKAFAASF